jgi:hypothetical protein
MKIASVTFFNPDTEFGGATTPAFAFQSWCIQFGHDCDLLVCPTPDMLNAYDAVFFNTPPRDHQEFCYSNLKVPFALMIHDETDIGKYEVFPRMVKDQNCKVLVGIDHDGDFYKDYHDTRVFWHPCCMPDDLHPRESANTSEIVLYAARITHWKNPDKFMEFVNKYNAKHAIYGRVDDDLFGIKSMPFPKNMDASSYDVFWDVCGNRRNEMKVKRLNLTSFEFISKGLMPIVNPRAIPKALRGAFIEWDQEHESYNTLYNQIKYYRQSKESRWDYMCARLSNSYASFENISSSVREIIHHVGN